MEILIVLEGLLVLHLLVSLPVMATTKNYKTLYEACAKQCAQKDRLIVLLQQQLGQLTEERQMLTTLIADLQQQLSDQTAQIKELQTGMHLQQQTIAAQTAQLSQQKTIITEQNILIETQQKELTKNKKDLFSLQQLRYEMATLKKWIYGIKSEKRHQPQAAQRPQPGDQLSLALDADSWGVCKIGERRRIPEHLRVIKTTEPQKPGGRHDFPPGLAEEITILDVEDKPANAKCIGHQDQRQLACDPMRWYIKTTRRLVYLAPVDEDALDFKQLIAPLPAHPIPKCKMDISVLVLLTIEKFLYHMPVWREQKRLRYHGINLPYSTLCSLVNRTSQVLEPLWHLLLKEIKNSGLVNIDETRYRVLDDSKKQGKKSHIGWMWASLNPVQRMVCFSYRKGRGKKDISGVLQGYSGYLMSDAYGVYTEYGKQPSVTHQHCLAHARRYFVYALENDKAKASFALDRFFGPLYDIEQECKLLNLDFDAITTKRQTESLPILEDLQKWLKAMLPQTTPKTPIYKAIHYALKNFRGLSAYISDGMLPIDNNELEGQIRSIALGRHNYLFAGSHRAAELAAVMYSFIATCKLQNIDPAKWLDDVLRRIPTQPQEQLMELLPQFWKPLLQKNAQTA